MHHESHKVLHEHYSLDILQLIIFLFEVLYEDLSVLYDNLILMARNVTLGCSNVKDVEGKLKLNFDRIVLGLCLMSP